MKSATSVYKMSCSCGSKSFSVRGQPVMRAMCHCHFCQDYNQAPYGDFVVYRANQLVEDDTEGTVFRSYSKSNMVMRGSCPHCSKPVLERANIPLFPKLLFVPVVNHPERERLPQPQLQMFSHRRIADVSEHIPAYSGYLGSEIPFLWKLIRAL